MANNEEKFSSIDDLYKRVLPALNTKVNEFKKRKINYISNKDIWNYCIDNLWKGKNDLRIYEMVDDILNTDFLKIEVYIRRKKNIN